MARKIQTADLSNNWYPLTGGSSIPATPAAGAGIFYGSSTSNIRPNFMNELGNPERILTNYNGLIKYRQGGTSGGSASWASPGSTNTTITDTNVIMQVGSFTSSGSGGVSVTFPVAFSQIPILVASKSSTSTTNFATVEVYALSTTGFSFNVWNAGGSRSVENIGWIAAGVA